MTNILCPTRGGKESHPNQDFAIELAKERGADLLFMYVSNIQLISRSGPPIVVDIEEELDELGDFLLAMAQERGLAIRCNEREGMVVWQFPAADRLAFEGDELLVATSGPSRQTRAL